MTRRVFCFIVVCFFSNVAFAAMPPSGKAAPDFLAVDALSGKPVALHDFKGHPVVLEWNNFDCPFVKKFYSVGEMQALQAEARKQGVVWISINSSAPGKEGYLSNDAAAKTAVEYRKAQPSYYVRDTIGAVGHLYGVGSTPTMFVIDREGRMAYSGAIDNKPSSDPADIAGATNYITEALNNLSQGRPVKIPVTQPYGCFVHY